MDFYLVKDIKKYKRGTMKRLTILFVLTLIAILGFSLSNPRSPLAQILENNNVIILLEQENNVKIDLYETNDIVFDDTKDATYVDLSKAGTQGIKDIVYEVQYKDDIEVARRIKSEETIIKPTQGLIVLGTKPVTMTEDILAKIEYIGVEEPIGYRGKKTVEDAVNGTKTTTITLNKETLQTKETVVIEEPVHVIIDVGIVEIKNNQTVAFTSEYLANKDALIGSENIIQVVGNDGLANLTIHYEVDKNSGELLNPSTVKTETLTQSIKQVELVGVKEVIKTVLPFSKVIQKDATRWDNYKQVQKGENGLKTEVVIHSLNHDGTVDVTNIEEVISSTTVDPITEVTVVGTKAPTWKTITNDTDTIEYTIVKRPFVSKTTFDSFGSVIDASNKIDEFNQLLSTHTKLSAYSYVETNGVDGKTQTSYQQAVDENNQVISGYSIRDKQTKTLSTMVPQKQVTLTVAVGDKRTTTPTYSYQANSELALNTQNVIKSAVSKVDQPLYYYSNGVGTALSATKWIVLTSPQPGIIEVGTQPTVKTVSIPYKTKVVYDASKTKEELNETTPGQNGVKSVTTTYSVNSSTGKTSVLKVSEVITKEPVDAVQRIGTKVVETVPTNGTFNTSAAIEALQLINSYRVSKGYKALVMGPQSDLAKAREQMIQVSLKWYITNDIWASHVPGGFNSNIARGYSYASRVVTAWKNSAPHNKELLDATASRATVVNYYDGKNIWWSFTAY